MSYDRRLLFTVGDQKYLDGPALIYDLDDEGDGLNNLYDWLNAHHFDYRGLIEKGLALEAPEGMYKTE